MLQRNIVAVIDVGSNSIKLLVAQKGPEDGSIEKLFSKTLEVRISEGIRWEKPKLTEDAISAGGHAIAVLVYLAKKYEPSVIKIVATSAVRDASNGREFMEQIKEVTGVRLDILSGIEEATLIGRGLRNDPLIADLENFVQIDIGGGSLELIRFKKDSIEQACSLQLGAVRLTEMFLPDRTPAILPETEATIQAHVLKSVEASGFQFEPATDPMVVTGGAFSVIRSILAAQSDEPDDSDEPDEISEDTAPVIDKNDVTELRKTLCRLSLEERKALPGLPVERADVMPAALVAIDTVLKCAGRDAVIQSSYNLRYGIAAELLG